MYDEHSQRPPSRGRNPHHRDLPREEHRDEDFDRNRRRDDGYYYHSRQERSTSPSRKDRSMDSRLSPSGQLVDKEAPSQPPPPDTSHSDEPTSSSTTKRKMPEAEPGADPTVQKKKKKKKTETTSTGMSALFNNWKKQERAIRDPEADPKPPPYLLRDQLKCLLCKVKLKSLHVFDLHVASSFHTEKMKDEALVKSVTDSIEKQYRDRAKERREAKARTAPKKDSSTSKKDTKPAPSKQPERVNKMLKNFGYSVDAATDRTGSNPGAFVAPQAYSNRVGLGAQDAILGDAAAVAERNTVQAEDPRGYLNLARDGARQRFKDIEEKKPETQQMGAKEGQEELPKEEDVDHASKDTPGQERL